MARLRYNGLQGILGAALTTTGQTAITFASALSSLSGAVPTLAGDYIPLVIEDEIVYLTAYTAAATSGTIVRGRENTTAATHANTVPFQQAPLASDLGISLDDLPIADSWDTEFDANNSTSLPAGWSWVNQGSASYLERYGRGVLRCPASASSDNHVIDKAIPGGSTWTVQAKMSVTGRDANFWQAGVVIRDSVTGKLFMFGMDGRGPCWVKWNSPTSYNSESTHYPWRYGSDFHVQITKNSSSSYDLALGEGASWVTLFTAIDIAGFVGTPDRLGILGNTEYGSPGGPIVSCHWMRKVA